MTSSYVFIVLLLSSSIFFQLINSQSILNDTTITTGENEMDQTSESTISVFNTTTTDIGSTTIESSDTTTTISKVTVSLDESTTSAIDSNRSSESPSKLKWWLLFIPLLTVTIVISIGIIHYYRRQSPYRRFLRNWRSRDDTDNIILQLEQPERINDQWPPRISFA